MSKRTEGFARLDALLADHGEGWLLSAFVSRISEGESPVSVSAGLGLPWFVVRGWLEDSPARMAQMELGKRCFADGLVWEGLEAARDATPESVSVDRLKVDTYHKLAARLSRDEWGDKVQMDVKTTHTVDIKGLLEAREARLMTLSGASSAGSGSSAPEPADVIAPAFRPGYKPALLQPESDGVII